MYNDGEPFTRSQAADLGLRPADLTEAVAAGVLLRLFRAVFLDSAADATVDVRARAALLVTPVGAVVGDRTAAWLRGHDLGKFNDPCLSTGIDLVVGPGRAPARRVGVNCRQAPLPAEDVTAIGELLVLTPQRNAVDFARYGREGWGVAAVDAYLRAGQVRRRELAEILGRYRGERGVARGRTIVGWGDRGAESVMESWSRWRFLDAGLPRPRTQVPVMTAEGRKWLDMGFVEYNSAGEYDGHEYHSNETGGHDYRRRMLLSGAMWDVVSLGTAEVLGARPVAALAMAEALMAAGWRPDPDVTRRLEAMSVRYRWQWR
jgi:hypothetical protein